MSLKASAWAWCVPVEKASERLVLLALADRADDKGYCYPSVKDICERTSLDRKAVFRALSTFSDRGVVTVQKRKGVHANSYTLAVDCPFLGSTEIGTSPNGNDPKEEQPLSPNGTDHCPQMGTTIVPKREQEPVNEPINNLPITDREDAPPKARAKKGEAWKKWIKVEKPDEVPDDLWKQFGEIRALKKRALTESALELLRSEGEKAHMTLLQVIEHCCANAWAGFRASWLTRTSGSTYRKPQNVTQTAEYRERLQACCRGEGRTEKLADDGVTIIVD